MTGEWSQSVQPPALPCPTPLPCPWQEHPEPCCPLPPGSGCSPHPLPSSEIALPQLALGVKAGRPLLQLLAFGKAAEVQNRRKVCTSNLVPRSCMSAQTRDGPAKAVRMFR